MGIKDMMMRLQKLLDKHGDIEVFFDCPFCEKSHTPNTIHTYAVHLTADLKKELGGK